MSDWIYDASEDPLNYEGFVYCIINKTSERKYIGRKYVYTNRKGKRVGEADWKNYWGSSKELKAALKAEGKDNFERHIIQFCKTRSECNFAEVEQQFQNDVLRAKLPNGEREFYNLNIMSRYWTRTVESYKRAKPNIVAGLRRHREDPSYRHPMQGRVHPNKGKNIPSGHKAALGKRVITDGVENRSVNANDTFVMPTGFYFGMTKNGVHHLKTKRNNKVADYAAAPNACHECGMCLPYDKRKNQFCCRECADAAHSNRMQGRGQNADILAASSLKKKQKTAEKYGFHHYGDLMLKAGQLHDQGLSFCKIAAALGCSRGLAYSLVKQARHQVEAGLNSFRSQ